MAKQKSVETVQKIEWVSIFEAFSRDPGNAINYLLHSPGFIAIVSFLAAFFFKFVWDLLRDNSRENAKVAMLKMMDAFSRDQFDARQKHEDKMLGLIEKIEAKAHQTYIDAVRLEHTLDKIETSLSHLDKRVGKIEQKIDLSG